MIKDGLGLGNMESDPFLEAQLSSPEPALQDNDELKLPAMKIGMSRFGAA